MVTPVQRVRIWDCALECIHYSAHSFSVRPAECTGRLLEQLPSRPVLINLIYFWGHPQVDLFTVEGFVLCTLITRHGRPIHSPLLGP